MGSLKHDEPNFVSDGDERSLPSIMNVLKLDPRNLLALREGKDMFWSHMCPVKREISAKISQTQ